MYAIVGNSCCHFVLIQRLSAGDTLFSVSPADNRCHLVLLDKDESCPTADLSNISRPNGRAYSTGELLNTPPINGCHLAYHNTSYLCSSWASFNNINAVRSSRLKQHNFVSFVDISTTFSTAMCVYNTVICRSDATWRCFEPFMGTLKPQSSVPIYSNTVIGTLAVDGWALTFGTAKRDLGGLRPRPVPSSLYQM